MKKQNKIALYTFGLLGTIVFICIQVWCDLTLPDYLYNIIANGIMASNIKYIFKQGGIMLLITLLSVTSTIIVSFLAARISSSYSRDLRNRTFKKIESFSLNEFDKFSTASLITRNTNDIQQIQIFIFICLRMILSAPFTAVFGIYKAIQTSKELAWIFIVAVPLALIIISLTMLLLVPKFNKVQGYIDDLNLVSRQSLTGIRVIRAFRKEKYEEEKFDKANVTLTRTNLFINRMMSFLMPVTFLILDFTQLAIVWFASKLVELGDMNPAAIMSYITYAILVMFSFLTLTMAGIFLPRAIVAWKRINEVLKTEPLIKDNKSIVTPNKDNKDGVVFENVSFEYPGANEKVLSNINFTAKIGQVTAIIGSTGCGKSTLVNLIPRFYDVTEGRILLNGIDIRNYSLENLHDQIGYAPQKAILFSGTIKSNITQGNKNATNEEIDNIISIAQAKEFVSKKDKGVDSEITQGGTNVSGGQKQRLAIARALAKNASVYIFDDSFSALDFKTDKMLRKELKPYTKNAATIIVGQRVSSIMDADTIIVLDNGKIAGMGTHKQLLKNCEVYKEIALSQLSKEELENE